MTVTTGMKPPRFTPEDLCKHTKPAGVDRINPIQMGFFGFERPLTFPRKHHDGGR
jgi:hypothetical protein